MAIGDVYAVEPVSDCHYVDTGLYGTPGYGSVYLLDSERPAVVDSGIGTNYESILQGLETVGIAPADLEVIALTHVHLDHAGGAGFLAEETGADVYVHGSGARFLEDPGPLWEGTKRAVGEQITHYTRPRPLEAARLETLEDGDEIDLGDRIFDVHHAPGHAFHQVVFHESDDDVVFTADAAGIYVRESDAVRESSPPPGFDLEGVVADARMIADLAPETLCYGHFGDAPAEGRLEEYVGTITRWVERVAEARERLGDDEAVVEHLVETTDIEAAWAEERAEAEIAMNVRGVLHYLEERESGTAGT